MGSNNRLASPQGASSPPGGGYSQTLNINDTQGPAPTPPWGGSAPKIPPHMLSDGVVSGVTGPTPDPLPQISSTTPMPAPTQTLKPQVLTMPASNPMFGPGGGMGMHGGGCGMQQQRCPSCGK